MELLYINYILSFIISVLFSRILISQILLISFEKKLFDSQDERKVHKGIIPRLGGVSFFPTFIFSFFLTIGINFILQKILHSNTPIELSQEWMFALCSITLLYLIGLKDDLIGMRYREKFAAQIIAAILYIASGLWINNLHGILGIHEIPDFIGIPFTILLIVFIINAINLIDGIDGLASGISIIALSFYGIFFSYTQLYAYSILAFTALGTLVSFFIFNVYGNAKKRHKIFMGDCGSLTLGMLLSIFLIKLSYLPLGSFETTPYTIVVAFSVLAVPMLDVLRVILHRARYGHHLFKADKNHIHHKFLGLGFSHKAAASIILMITFFFSVANIFAIFYVNINIILLADILIWTGINMYLTVQIKKKASFLIKDNTPAQGSLTESKKLN